MGLIKTAPHRKVIENLAWQLGPYPACLVHTVHLSVIEANWDIRLILLYI